MSIPSIYQVITKSHSFGISSYNTPRYYEGVRSIDIKKPKLSKPKHKKTYIYQIQKLSKSIPASNCYFHNPQVNKSPKKPTKKIDFQSEMKKGSYTFIDEQIKKSNKIPPVGQYQLQSDNNRSQIKLRYKIINDKKRKEASKFRSVQTGSFTNHSNLKVGPGLYHSYKKLQFGNTSPKYSVPHTKRQETFSKVPSCFVYKPVPVNYKTFTKIQGQKIKKKSCTFGKKLSLPNLNKFTFGPGPKYSLISTWVPTNDSFKTKVVKKENNVNIKSNESKNKLISNLNLLKLTSRSPPKSIYRN